MPAVNPPNEKPPPFTQKDLIRSLVSSEVAAKKNANE